MDLRAFQWSWHMPFVALHVACGAMVVSPEVQLRDGEDLESVGSGGLSLDDRSRHRNMQSIFQSLQVVLESEEPRNRITKSLGLVCERPGPGCRACSIPALWLRFLDVYYVGPEVCLLLSTGSSGSRGVLDPSRRVHLTGPCPEALPRGHRASHAPAGPFCRAGMSLPKSRKMLAGNSDMHPPEPDHITLHVPFVRHCGAHSCSSRVIGIRKRRREYEIRRRSGQERPRLVIVGEWFLVDKLAADSITVTICERRSGKLLSRACGRVFGCGGRDHIGAS